MKLSAGERVFEVFNTVFLMCLGAVFLIPVLTVLSTSLISPEEYARRGAFILVPQAISFQAYRLLLAQGSIIYNAYLVTIFRTTVGTFLDLAMTSSLAYVLARKQLPGRTFLTLFVFLTMIFSGGLIPTFVLVGTLGLLNSVWSLILPGLINPWFLLIMRNFFMAIPAELEEAATVDGANPLTIFWKIVLPLSLPSIATIGLFYAVWHWNSWFDAAIFIRDQDKMPIQVILRSLLDQSQVFQSQIQDPALANADPRAVPPGPVLDAAMIVISTVPILVVYPFIQKYFVKGALIGSVKG